MRRKESIFSFQFLGIIPLITKSLLLIPIAFLLFIFNTYSQLSFSGFGRTVIQKQELSGDILKNDSLSDRISTTGYSLFDIRTTYQAGDWFKFSADTRLKNFFGGFGGVGLSLQVRQIKLEGLVSKYVKYTLGDVDVKMSPFTFWNYAEPISQSESEIFQFRRNIVQYENFNFDNHWRMRGAHIKSVINLKGERSQLKFQVFSLVNRSETKWKNTTPRRTGGSAGWFFKDYIEISGNSILFIQPLELISLDHINVNSSIWKTMLPIKNWLIGTKGEFGSSKAFSNYILSEDKSDYFIQSKIQAEQTKLGLSFSAGYQEVGPYFRNPGAQTLRNSGNAQPEFFSTFSNNSLPSIANMLDRTSDEKIQNRDLQAYRNSYLPQYSLVSPYGNATPNRMGYFLEFSFLPKSKMASLEMKTQNFSEIKGEGVFNKRKFNTLNMNGMFSFSKALGFKKSCELNAAFRQESSKRAGGLPVKMEIDFWELGSKIEFIKDVNFLFGFKSLSANGNEVYSNIDAYNEIQTYTPFTFENKEYLLGTGFQFHFTEKCFLMLSGYFSKNENSQNVPSYSIDQFYSNFSYQF
jgi:hypothetical protein